MPDLPAGRLKTPAPTMDLMRLKTSLGIDAVPPPWPPRGISAAAVSACNLVETLGVLDLARDVVGVTNPDAGNAETSSRRSPSWNFMVV